MDLSVRKIRFLDGAYKGFTHPSVSVIVRVRVTEDVAVKVNASQAIIEAIPQANEHLSEMAKNEHPARALLSAAVLITQEVLLHFDHLAERPPVTHAHSLGADHFTAHLQVSCLSARAFIAALDIAWIALKRLIQGEHSLNLSHPKLRTLISQLRADAPHGFNTKFLLLEAQNRQIPWMRIWANVFQLGYGCHARLFDSSVSDSTSKIGTTLAGNKTATNSVLRSAGFPAVKSTVVTSAQMAVEEAAKIGTPIVIKPASTEGGEGVFAMLYHDAEIIRAYDEAQKLSKVVLVEAFFEGKDYRVHVVNGKVHGVIERQPAAVIGDGKSSVAQLIAKVNRERELATDDRQYLHPIKADDETQRVCALQEYSLADVPPADTSVRLSAICNVATGGQPKELDLSAMHADNEKLCIDVAQLLRLDIAGVDLLIPDIGISWQESGAHICEVNHKPQMFTSFFPALLDSFFAQGNGKIPIYLVLEAGKERQVSYEQVNKLEALHDNVCWVTDDFSKVGASLIQERVPLMQAAKSALMRPDTEALLVTLSTSVAIQSGWPFGYCSCLIVVVAEEKDVASIKSTALYQEIVGTLKPEVIDVVANH